ncbi:MAG: DNA polymerase IV [Eubacteriales bacterium]|nr:DNA polymerase IV [Eubacteriales bacterium]
MRKIIHLDMDAFFASVEERDNPAIVGKPVIVGSPPGTRGVVSTCNYIARKYGVHSAMSSAEAYRRCPSAVFIKPHFAKYKDASDKVHAIMAEYTDKIEFVSLDEGYMDVTGSEFVFGAAEDIAKTIQRRVFETVRLTCSVGVGYSMMSAKCASEEKKPRGFFVIRSPREFAELMKNRPVGELYGIGKKTAERLNSIGIRTVGQLAAASDERLYMFKNMAHEMRLHAEGIDNREVTPNAAPKSIGRETTFLTDMDSHKPSDRQTLYDTLYMLADDVSFRLYRKGLWCKTVTLKLKFADMKSITRAYSGGCVRSREKLYSAAKSLFDGETINKNVRLIGISTSNLTDIKCEQLSFMAQSGEDMQKEVLSDTVMRLKNDFGRGAIKTAKELAVIKKYGGAKDEEEEK